MVILDDVVSRIHSVLEAFDTDLVTVDLFTSVLAEIEKCAWMLRNANNEDGGLSWLRATRPAVSSRGMYGDEGPPVRARARA